MNITILTLFPEVIDAVLGKSIIGRAVDAGILSIRAVDIRDFAPNRYGKVDDTLYGGGTGMLMMCQPVYDAWCSVTGGQKKGRTLYMSPKGKVFHQQMAVSLAKEEELILLCGHYEGIDQRVLDEIVDEEISIGDYVLTGGEIAACTVVDAVARLIPGVLPDEDAYRDESHMNYALEHPQYTKPAVWNGRAVPEVLLSGHHRNIRDWKRIRGLYETLRKRPDLFDRMEIGTSDLEELIRIIGEESGLSSTPAQSHDSHP